MEEKEKSLKPGDLEYKGGSFFADVFVDGKCKRAHVVKDQQGNVVYASVTDKILGIF